MHKISVIHHMMAISLALVISACVSTNNDLNALKTATNNADTNQYVEVKNARQKLQWAGVYQGIFPCSNCEGIATMLKINPDMSFVLRTRELGREDIDNKSEGKFVWLKDNSHIQLQGTETQRIFRVGNGFIELMGNNGKPVTTNRKSFILEKTD